MKSIKISIIIPVYNSSAYLKACLDAIKSQTLTEYEVILINDGSTDDSEMIIDLYTSDPRFIKINQKNQGQACARNNGLKKAKGEYVLFLDSDDVYELDTCEKAYQKAIDTNASIVVFDFFEIMQDKKQYKKACEFNINDVNKQYFLSIPAPWNKLFKRSMLKEAKFSFLEGRIYEDLAAIPLLFSHANNQISFLEEPLYQYFIRLGSTMNQPVYHKKLEDIFIVGDYIKEQLIKYNKLELYQTELEYLMIEHLLHSASLRFLRYPNQQKNFKKIRTIMKIEYPNWKSNPYFKQKSWKYQLACHLFYCNQGWLVKQLVKKQV